MSNTVIKVENLSKLYRLGEVGTGTVSHDLNRWFAKIRGKEDPFALVGQVNDRTQKSESDYVWSLKDINFEVKQGDVLGIIGKNGAGKSTLLKLLSQITSPTTGEIKVKGRIAALLEVGTGMHPEMTARENIFLNGAIMGMRKHEIKAKFDEIIDFAGCAMYVNTPIKRFSSGMRVRLGFAVAAFLEPEILIVDEVLAVGDAEFQKKAIGKMQDVSAKEGRTVLFVSHNMGAVRRLCKTGIVLQNGKISYAGDIDSTISVYLNDNNTNNNFYNANNNENEKAVMLKVFVTNGNNSVRDIFLSNEKIVIELEYAINQILKGMRVVFYLLDEYGDVVFASTNHAQSNVVTEKGVHKAKIIIPENLLNNKLYTVQLQMGIPGIEYILPPKKYINFKVQSAGSHGSDFAENWPGMVAPKLTWI